MLEIHEIPVTPYLQNCTLLVCTETNKATVCDCGDAAPVLAKIAQLGVEVDKVIATHGHLDHIGGTAEILAALQVPFHFPRGDDFLREQLPLQAQVFGWGDIAIPEVDVDLVHGDVVQVGNTKLQIRHCPGHTPGHVVFYEADSQQMVAGDVLFQGSVGRTDLPGGCWEDLQASIRTQIYSLPPQTMVHCGHGPPTTIGREATSNPFVRA